MTADPISVRAVLSRWLRATKLDAELLPYVIAQSWPQLVGERIAERTRPVALKEGQLTVEVASSAWLNELTFLRARLLAEINDRLARLGAGPSTKGRGAKATRVRELRLVVGRSGVAARRRPAAPPSRPKDEPPEIEGRSMPLPLDLQVELSRVTDPDLGRAIRRAWTLAQHFLAQPPKRPSSD